MNEISTSSADFLKFNQPPPPPVFDGNHFRSETTSLACSKCDSDLGVQNHSFQRSYVPPIAYGALLLAPIIGLILIVALRVQHELTLPFCTKCLTRQKRTKLFMTLGAVSIIAAFVAGFMLMLQINSGWVFFIPLVIPAALFVLAEVNQRQSMPKFTKIARDQIIVQAGRYGEIAFSKTTTVKPIEAH